MKTKVIIVRHAECYGNIENKLSGVTDFDITEKGYLQIEKVSKRLKSEKIDCIYTSPLKRAYLTALGIAKESGIKDVNIDNNLIEINYGDCDGMSWSDIDNKYPKIRGEWKEKSHYPLGIPNQEPYSKLQKRIKNEIEDIIRNNIEKTICIVSHGIAIGSFMCAIYNLPFERVNELKTIGNTGITILEYENGMYNILLEADNSHSNF